MIAITILDSGSADTVRCKSVEIDALPLWVTIFVDFCIRQRMTNMDDKINLDNKLKTDSSLKKLTRIQHYVTQGHGTEPPFSGRLLHNRREGFYHCLICESALFCSDSKYDSGCGWPSFYEPVRSDAVKYVTDRTYNMQRVEIRCSECDAHLGHVFPEETKPTGERYCVNSASMRFIDSKNSKKTSG